MDNETQELEIPEFKRVSALINTDTRDKYNFLSDRTTIGRQPGNQIVLAHDMYVSGHHAVIYFDGDLCRLEDLGSRNGTLKNGVPLAEPVSIAPGDVITIGRTKFEVM